MTHITSGKTFYLTNAYGPPTWDGKDEFCSELLSLNGTCTNKWVIYGDFNLTKNQPEIKGKPWSRKIMGMFSDLINSLAVIDLPLSNQTFIWSNMQLRPTLAKLDRFLVSTEWDQSFPFSKVKALLKITFDHTTILLFTLHRPVPRRFRFEKVWLTKEDFLTMVPIWWNEVNSTNSTILTITAKLKHCRTRIEECCKTFFHSIIISKRILQEELQKIDLLEEQQELP